jgi:hypothetical protein
MDIRPREGRLEALGRVCAALGPGWVVGWVQLRPQDSREMPQGGSPGPALADRYVMRQAVYVRVSRLLIVLHRATHPANT